MSTDSSHLLSLELATGWVDINVCALREKDVNNAPLAGFELLLAVLADGFCRAREVGNGRVSRTLEQVEGNVHEWYFPSW